MNLATARSHGKPSPDFEIRLVGRDMRPWEVPMRSLARMLYAVQRLIERTGEEDPEKVHKYEEEAAASHVPLHLIQVISGSTRYAVSANDRERTIKTLTETGVAIRDANAEDWDSNLLSPIEDLSGIARSLACSIEFRAPGRRGEVFVTISGDSYATLAARAFVTGDSSVYGYLERVGGTTELRCNLRVPSQPSRLVYCTIQNEDLVRELGQHLYQNVFVSGRVTWFRKAWWVKTIFIKGFEPPKTGSIRDTLNRIYEAGGKAWDEMDDPESEMRGDA